MPVFRHEQSDKEKAASKRGKAARRKGHDAERELVREFNEVLKPPWHAERRLQVKGGKGKGDVEISYEADPVFHIESKRRKRPNIKAALEQAEQDCRAGVMPIAYTRADREEAIVSMRMDTFIVLLKAYTDQSNG